MSLTDPCRTATAMALLSVGLSAPLDADPISLVTGLNFTGSSVSESGFIPPDTMGSVGPSHVVELINGRYKVYSKTDGSTLRSRSLDQFWSDAGASYSGSTFDPRVVYDHDSQRWFAVSVDNARSANSLLLAVSASSNPLDGWTGFSLDTDPNDVRWADFPTLGVDADGVYASANMFALSSGSTTISLWSLPKADLTAATPTVANRTAFLDQDPSTVGFALQPAVDFGASDGRAAILAADADVYSRLNRTNILEADTSSATLSSSVDIDTPLATSNPPDADQPGTKNNIETNDVRFASAVFEQGDSLWGVHNVTYNGHAALRWYELNETNNALLQSGTIYDSSLDYYFPSIAANQLGHVVIGFSGSSASQYVSTYAALGVTSGGTTVFGDPLLLKAGVDDYQLTDGVGRNRWGDYSATALDPDDPLTFWTFQEFVSGDNQWSTQITQLSVGIPEPATALLFGAGTLLLLLGRRRRRSGRIGLPAGAVVRAEGPGRP